MSDVKKRPDFFYETILLETLQGDFMGHEFWIPNMMHQIFLSYQLSLLSAKDFIIGCRAGTAHLIWLKATKEFCNSVKVRQFSPFEQICIRIWDVLKLSKNLILAFKAVGRNQISFFSNSIRMHFFHCFLSFSQDPSTNNEF